MIYCPDKYKKETKDVNAWLNSLEGELKDKDARKALAEFLRANLGFATELLLDIKLAPFQEAIMRGMLNRNFSMIVAGRGTSKSYSAAVFALLLCIFEPETKILIAGPTFRTARFIFNYIEKIIENPKAPLAGQCIAKKSKGNDVWELAFTNGSTIKAIPLNGEKIRGFRANVLLLDEFLLLPEVTIKNVLMPFLVAPQDMKDRLNIVEMENELIAEGLMTEEERTVFKNNSKMVALSSASYTFENLYKTFTDWTAKIYSNDAIEDATYMVAQISYEAVPTHMIDQGVIEEAKNGGTSHSGFLREYCAQFTDGGDSYFSAKKMHECTIPDGEQPTTQIKGFSEKKYLLAIDPSFSNAPNSDYFAMALMELDEDTNTSALVHGYAVAGGNLKSHIKYFYYLLTNFNIEMIIIDNAGYQFIDSANENELFTKKGINLKFIDLDPNIEGEEYLQALKQAKKQINKEDHRICINQYFSSEFLRRSNNYLQACIDHKKIWFASRVQASQADFERASMVYLPNDMIGHESVLDLIEFQDDIIYQTKRQCALIEVKSTAKGTQSFDLPAHLKKDTSEKRARRDNYTALLLGTWLTKIYFELGAVNAAPVTATFTPMML